MTSYSRPARGAELRGDARPKKAALDIPRIKLLSRLGLESIVWSVIIGHLVKWAGNWSYFAAWQVRYGVGYQNTLWSWSAKDTWDRLPDHISNLLGFHWANQAAPAWWVTWRHDIRDVGIALVATIIVQLLFTKPKHSAYDKLSTRQFVMAFPAAIGAALIPIIAIGLLAWQVPWLQQHGWQVPAQFGALASEVNGWIAAGTWIATLMGILGGIAARKPVKRVADYIQWFFARRSAGKIQSTSGLNKLRGSKVVGTPVHRKRVHWLLDHQPDLPQPNPWLARVMIAGAFVGVVFAAAGAWLTLVGPAAVH